eukprot:gene3729-2061_t
MVRLLSPRRGKVCYPRRCTPAWVVGGPRSGTLLHQDPLCTCGWNLCLSGTKRWCLVEPRADVRELGLSGAEGPAAWFVDHLPALRAAAAAGDLRVVECLQGPGDLVYIPHEWHHCVVSIDTSFAVAHTLVTPAALPLTWPRLCAGQPLFARVLQDVVAYLRPPLHAALQAAADSGGGHVRCDRGAAGARLALPWRALPHGGGAAGGADVVLVPRAWLRARLLRRPYGDALLAARADGTVISALERARAYHETMGALAAAVADRRALLCLLDDDGDGATEAEAAAHDAALAQHGLRAAAAVAPGDADRWAAAQGAGGGAPNVP